MDIDDDDDDEEQEADWKGDGEREETDQRGEVCAHLFFHLYWLTFGLGLWYI